MRRIFPALALAAALLGGDALAQDATRPPIGTPITLEQAKRAIAAAEAEAVKNHWNSAIAIVEPSGALVYFVKMDGTQYGAINAALDKATSAALFRRSTNAVNEALKAGATYLLQLRGTNAVPGGFPIVIDGRLVGAIGTSGGTGDQDSQVSMAAVKAFN
jgi:uncharacterized protein GlcG (DUF336 family)